jgi:hypothetical protein
MKLKNLTRRVEKLERAAAESERNKRDIVERTLDHIRIKAMALALTGEEVLKFIDDCKKSPDHTCRLSLEMAERILERGNAISRECTGKNWLELHSLSHAQLEELFRNRGITNVAQITRII